MAGIIELSDAKAQINITSPDYDLEIQDFIDAITAPVEAIVGPVVPQEIEEVHESGRRIFLGKPPVLSLISLDPVLTGGESYSPANLDVSPETGVVRRVDGGGFTGPLRVTYEAGREPIPANIIMAGRIIVEDLWETQRGPSSRPGLGADEDDESPNRSLGILIPPKAYSLLRGDRRGPVVL